MTVPRLDLKRLDAAFGAEITGIDLSRPLDAATVADIQDAFDRHCLLLFRNQQLDPAAFARFARHFGPLLRFRLLQPRPGKHAEHYSCPEEPDVTVIGTVERNGWPAPMFTNSVGDWHIDEMYKPRPNRATALYAVETPGRGDDTVFAGMHAAYDALDDDTKARIEPLAGVYSVERLDAMFRASDPARPPLTERTLSANPPVRHPLVRSHPATGRNGLFIAREPLSHVEGVAPEASSALVHALAAHAVRPQFQYRHTWHAGDVLIWDNHFTMHRATAFDPGCCERLLLRTMIADR
ncbi:MAG: TauD/TfdA dioxygenase family protein [Hyphomicrobiales bacterium]